MDKRDKHNPFLSSFILLSLSPFLLRVLCFPLWLMIES